MKDNVLGFIGILFRANKAIIGESARLSKKGRVAFLAIDASEATKKEIIHLCKTSSTPLYEDYSKGELGSAVGYSEVSYVLIIDKKAATSLEKKRKDIR